MLKDAIKLVNKYMALDADDRDAFDSLRRDRMRLETSRESDNAPKRRRRRKKMKIEEPLEPTPEPHPAGVPKRRVRKPKQKTIDEAINETSEDPLDAALKGVM